MYSAEAAGFSLALEEGQDVALSDGALHIADQASVGVVDKGHFNLGDATTGA